MVLLTARKTLLGSCLLAMAFLVDCQSCGKGDRIGDMGMCGKCNQSADCRTGLSCVNEVCETAPPSCHVKIGL